MLHVGAPGSRVHPPLCQITDWKPYEPKLSESSLKQLNLVREGSHLYSGNPRNPRIGDVRLSFRVAGLEQSAYRWERKEKDRKKNDRKKKERVREREREREREEKKKKKKRKKNEERR